LNIDLNRNLHFLQCVARWQWRKCGGGVGREWEKCLPNRQKCLHFELWTNCTITELLECE